MHDPRYLCLNTSMSRSLDSYANDSVEVESFPVTRELIGVECLLHAATIRSTGRAVVLVMPRLSSEKILRPQCVVVVVKHLNVLTTCREIW